MCKSGRSADTLIIFFIFSTAFDASVITSICTISDIETKSVTFPSDTPAFSKKPCIIDPVPTSAIPQLCIGAEI
jgi:hypothetical protein